MSFRLAHSVAAFFFVAQAVSAQQSGVLLGLRDSGTGASRYRTLWIAPESGTLRVVASGPDLIVPGRTAFWRVCVIGDHSLKEGELSVWDSLVVRPASADRGACARTDSGPTNAEQQNARCDSTTESEILFASGDAISVEAHFEGTCGMHPTGDAEVRLQSIDGRELKLEEFLTVSGRETLLKHALQAGREQFADFGSFDRTTPDATTDQPRAHLVLEHMWAVERGHGQWQVVATASCSPHVTCGGTFLRFSVTGFAPPAALVGHDALSPNLDAIRARYPGVKDAVSSPRGDVVVALTDDSLLVFTPNAGRLGAPVFSQAMHARIVSAQWAIGRFVPVWSDQLKRVLVER
jgi:hypothetical protein